MRSRSSTARPVTRPPDRGRRPAADRGVVRTLCCWTFAFVLAACAKPGAREEAIVLAQRGDDASAIGRLREHLREHPGATAERRLLIRLLGVRGQLRDAELEATRLSRHLGPKSPVPWVELGLAYELAHRYEEALELFDRAASLAPSDPLGARTGGLRAARWGELEWAAPRLEEALRRDPRDGSVWHALGLVRMQLGDTDAARHAYESGLRANPQALENRIGLATLAWREGNPGGALRQYEALLRLRPAFTEAHLGRSLALIELGRLDEARRAIATARDNGADEAVIARQLRLIEQLELKRSPHTSQ